MPEKPTPEETVLWQRRLASQANNRAWRLSESLARTPAEDEDMLQAAHAAMYFWKIVGNAGNHAHAALLLAHVYALLRLAAPAAHYLAQAQPRFFSDGAQAWEVAIAHAVAANVAAASGEAESHGTHYRKAFELVSALPDVQDRKVLEATLRVVPKPAEGTM